MRKKTRKMLSETLHSKKSVHYVLIHVIIFVHLTRWPFYVYKSYFSD